MQGMKKPPPWVKFPMSRDSKGNRLLQNKSTELAMLKKIQPIAALKTKVHTVKHQKCEYRYNILSGCDKLKLCLVYSWRTSSTGSGRAVAARGLAPVTFLWSRPRSQSAAVRDTWTVRGFTEQEQREPTAARAASTRTYACEPEAAFVSL